MADFWKVDQKSTDGAIRYWDLIETMLTAGWTMPDAGDGLAAYGAGQVTHGGSGVNGLGNIYAWVRVQDPAGVREFIFQRTTSSTNWHMVYSKADKFVGGTPSVTVRPTAADELVIVTNVAMQSVSMARHHAWASDVSPYPFYLVGYTITDGMLSHLTMMDATRGDPADADPVIVLRGTGSAYSTVSSLNTTDPYGNNVTNLSAWGWTTQGVAFNIMVPYGQGTSTLSGFGSAAVPQNSLRKDGLIPGTVMRRPHLSAPMLKGLTTHCLLAGVCRASSSTYTVNAARDKIHIATVNGGFVLPWNGEIPLV